MYAALDLGQRTIRAVLKSQDGKIVNELKILLQRQQCKLLHIANNASLGALMREALCLPKVDRWYLLNYRSRSGYYCNQIKDSLCVDPIRHAKIQELSNMYMVSLNELAVSILSFKMTMALEKDPTLFLKDIPDNALLEESS